MKEPIRILHVVGSMHAGGMENFIMNLYRNIDRSKIQFDVIVHAQHEGDYTDEIKKLGGNIFQLPRLTSHPIKNLRGIYHLVKKNKYPIVIRHTANALVAPQLLVAKLAGAKTICHSHNTTDPKMKIHLVCRELMGIATVKRFACSEGAGKWMFDELDFQIIHNAIDVQRFSFQDTFRNEIRSEYGIENKHVYGHIANFIASKNHVFLMDIFEEIQKKDKDAFFICMGDGVLRQEIEALAKEKHLDNYIIFTGSRRDVEKFMSCFDIMIFPSLFEGLPLTLIEAQAAGLPCLISDTITPEVIVTQGLVEQKSLELSAQEWANKAIETVNKERNRVCQIENIKKNGYDVTELVSWYQDYMCRLSETK